MNLVMRTERMRRGWTLDFVGAQIGYTKATVHDFEIGRRKPSYTVLCKLEELFCMAHRELFAEAADGK